MGKLNGKIAVIGVGGWGKNHVRVLKELEAEGLIDGVIAVDIDYNKLKIVRSKFNVEVETSYDRVLRREDVVGVIISTPTPLHYIQALKAVEHGKHMLVEKPLTVTLDEALRIYDKVRGTNLVVSVGLIMRYHPAVNMLKQIINEGKLGKPLTVRGKRTSWWPLRSLDVGVVKDLAIHDIDITHYALETMIKTVYCRAGSLKHDYEDYAIIMCECESSVVGVFEVNWLTPYKTRVFEVTGEYGIVKVDFVSDMLELQLESETYSPRVPLKEPLKSEDEDFILSILEKRSPKVKMEDAITALAVCEAALRSAKTGKDVVVENPLV